jgi:hypothetical protein
MACVCETPFYQLRNAETNLYEAWYVYDGT